MSDALTTTARLLKKLSAVRVTLNDDERALLDQIVLNASISASDVSAHAMTSGPASGKTFAADDVAAHGMKAGPASGKTLAADDVAAHAMTSGPASGKTFAADDVAAHAMTSGPASGPASGGKLAIRFALNDSEGYSVKQA
jgi:hypothetical protein